MIIGSQEEDFIVSLSSLVCGDVHPNNATGSFQNNIIPLNLNPSRNYEVAMHDIFIPRKAYYFHREDKDSVTEVYVERFP